MAACLFLELWVLGGGWIGSLVARGRRAWATLLVVLLLPVNLLAWGALWADPADPGPDAPTDYFRTKFHFVFCQFVKFVDH